MTAIHDLRGFLEVLEKNGQLLHITDAVQLEPDIGAAGRAISQLGETMPALSFEKIKGYQKARIVTNIHGSWANHALMMGLPKDSETRTQFSEFVGLVVLFSSLIGMRSEERRVGKECRSRWSPYH